MNDPAWYVDSGATNHITADLNNLALRTDYKGKEKFLVGNGQSLHISHVGSYAFNSKVSAKPFVHNKVRCVPAITKNLLSISQITKDNDIVTEFYFDSCVFKDKASRKVLLQGKLKHGLYQLTAPQIITPTSFQSSPNFSPASVSAFISSCRK